jgi:hypothetical protein
VLIDRHLTDAIEVDADASDACDVFAPAWAEHIGRPAPIPATRPAPAAMVAAPETVAELSARPPSWRWR